MLPLVGLDDELQRLRIAIDRQVGVVALLLGVAADFAALARFMPLLIGGGTDDETQLAEILAKTPSVRPFRP